MQSGFPLGKRERTEGSRLVKVDGSDSKDDPKKALLAKAQQVFLANDNVKPDASSAALLSHQQATIKAPVCTTGLSSSL